MFYNGHTQSNIDANLSSPTESGYIRNGSFRSIATGWRCYNNWSFKLSHLFSGKRPCVFITKRDATSFDINVEMWHSSSTRHLVIIFYFCSLFFLLSCLFYLPRKPCKHCARCATSPSVVWRVPGHHRYVILQMVRRVFPTKYSRGGLCYTHSLLHVKLHNCCKKSYGTIELRLRQPSFSSVLSNKRSVV